VRFAQTLGSTPATGTVRNPADLRIKYVVQTDITAFYEGIDHGILSRELLTHTGDYFAIECLVSLLGEVQGRSFGLPQLFEPSDRLSEVYIDIAERNILRRGWAAWRFNDDFRVAVADFSDALAVIEDLANAARELGLTLSDLKTTTPRFSTYLLHNFGLKVDDELLQDLSRLHPEDAVGNYTEGFGEENPTHAVELISQANTPGARGRKRNRNGVDLTNIHGDTFRSIRRALSQLARTRMGDALQDTLKLFAFVPSLTPWVIRYVVAAGDDEPNWAGALAALDQMIATVSLSDWQKLWVIHALDELKALDPDAPGDTHARKLWVHEVRDSRAGAIVIAEATLALSKIGAVEFDDVEYGLRTQPMALAPWYLAGVSRLRLRDEVTVQQYTALRGEGGLYTALLPDIS
jgi:hypothetical protein